MPTLISNHNKQVIEKRLAKYYSEINQAITLSETENGPYATWDFDLSSQDFYKTYLAKYLNVLKVDFNSDVRFLTIYFADGSAATMGYTKCLNFYPKSPKELYNATCSNHIIENQFNKYGKDVFEFDLCYGNNSWADKKFEPMDTAGCTTQNQLSNDYLYQNCENPNNGRSCTEIIRRNGWKIPKDYPIKI